MIWFMLANFRSTKVILHLSFPVSGSYEEYHKRLPPFCSCIIKPSLQSPSTRYLHHWDEKWWCQKNHQWATRSSRALDKNLHNTKAEDLKRSTSVVPAKYPPTVKLEKSLVHNSRMLRGKIMRTLICEGIGVFIVVESLPLRLGLQVFSL